MKMTQKGYALVIGIDVSKAKLDIAWGSNGPLETIENTDKQIAQLLIDKIEDRANTLIVMEATGGYESGLVDLLHKSNLALAVVNPRRVRDFADGIENGCDRREADRFLRRSGQAQETRCQNGLGEEA